MYTLTEKEENGLRFLVIANSQNTSKATLCLNQGGRMSGLEFDGIKVLADFHPSNYGKNYASSILFPFANRIKDGKYTFNGTDYILNCNETDKNNALHGIVYDKIFDLVDQELTPDSGEITLQFTHNGTNKGFPFRFQIQLIYKLTRDKFSLAVEITNQDIKPFPFVLGWHPYFESKNLKESHLNFESKTQFLHDQQQIISGTIPFDMDMPYQLKDVKLDDGYILESDTVEFLTPDYRLEISSTSQENYLQLYTPDIPDVIAIEPMTGANNSFNNMMGLQILSPKGHYHVKWTIAFENSKTIKNN
ncbi:aldose 1-epimerase [Gelidibacter sp.]|uniref:aldose 1-epimerase n=1 Tax=Gelidibacter sp. TaxID=2018083 RepID=UPI002C7AD9A9|nr:aldose 1-epimerase [Gelidibacter sp.]HUH26927.1 aldose 1-epimerase [Gelidibacter sp.]